MRFIVEKSELTGKVPVPASKSHTIRALVIASLADGVSTIRSPLMSQDTESAIRVFRALGAKIEVGEDWVVTGTGGNIAEPIDQVDVGNSGTTLYIAMSTAALGGGRTIFTGDAQTRSRPAGPLIKSLNDLGAEVSSIGGNGMAPLEVKGKLKGGRTSIECPTSQYLTSLLLSCPLVKGDSEIEVTQLFEQPYVEMTLAWLDEQGIEYERDGFSRFRIKGGQKFKAFDKTVPADFSSATFFLCAGAIAGHDVCVQGLDMNDSQGDSEVVAYLLGMGAMTILNNDAIHVSKSGMHGIAIDMNSTPDALPAMAAMACFAGGETKLQNVPQARLKETDRISVMCKELRKMGADIEEMDDGLIVRESKLTGAKVDGHDDHRVVMALAVAGLAAEGTTVIDKAESVAVTFPNFMELMQNIGANIRAED
jgi:3-phosphoshikimate 1-carboxyvinyltransferase